MGRPVQPPRQLDGADHPKARPRDLFLPNNKELAFTTNKLDDPKLVEQLEAQKVKFHADPQSRWLTDIVGWMLPLLVLVCGLFSV